MKAQLIVALLLIALALGSVMKIDQKNDEDVISLTCAQSLSNSKKFKSVKMSTGSHAIVKCIESCATSPSMIYVSGQYTKDSSICKAAFHSGKIRSTGGQVKIVFSKGARNNQTTTIGIRSIGKTYSWSFAK